MSSGAAGLLCTCCTDPPGCECKCDDGNYTPTLSKITVTWDDGDATMVGVDGSGTDVEYATAFNGAVLTLRRTATRTILYKAAERWAAWGSPVLCLLRGSRFDLAWQYDLTWEVVEDWTYPPDAISFDPRDVWTGTGCGGADNQFFGSGHATVGINATTIGVIHDMFGFEPYLGSVSFDRLRIIYGPVARSGPNCEAFNGAVPHIPPDGPLTSISGTYTDGSWKMIPRVATVTEELVSLAPAYLIAVTIGAVVHEVRVAHLCRTLDYTGTHCATTSGTLGMGETSVDRTCSTLNDPTHTQWWYASFVTSTFAASGRKAMNGDPTGSYTVYDSTGATIGSMTVSAVPEGWVEAICDCEPTFVQLGTGGTVVTTGRGRLYLRYNDDDFNDNTDVATWSVTINGESFSVGAADEVDTGLCFEPGDVITFSATGAVAYNNGTTDTTDADGNPVGGRTPAPFEGVPGGSGFYAPGLTVFSLAGKLKCEPCEELP